MHAPLSTLLVALALGASGAAHAQSATPAETLVGQQVISCTTGGRSASRSRAGSGGQPSRA